MLLKHKSFLQRWRENIIMHNYNHKTYRAIRTSRPSTAIGEHSECSPLVGVNGERFVVFGGPGGGGRSWG